jgi:carbonic anhydrase
MHVKYFAALAVLVATAVPVTAFAAWLPVATEQGKRVEIDRESIVATAVGEYTAKCRIVLDKPIVDPKTSASYRIIEVLNRYDCSERTHATLKRSYFKDEGELLRQEEVKSAFDMPVRTGTPDDRLLREVCRPKGNAAAANSGNVGNAIERANEAAAEVRKANDALVKKEVKKDLQRLTSRSEMAISGRRGSVSGGTGTQTGTVSQPKNPWSYEGSGGPDNWSRLKTEYATCASGRRQSPIDLGDGIAVDLEPIQFSYRPAPFRVVDSNRGMQMTVNGGGFSLLGKSYELIRVQFHRPSEITVAGRAFEMDAQLVHKSEDGKLAIVTVLLEKGAENPLVQMALNNLPLEKGGEVSPEGQNVDVARLLPDNPRYFAFMGSLTTPPCTEDVLWLVLKQPQQISSEQLAIFQRLYPPNARPVQPGFGRVIKESR